MESKYFVNDKTRMCQITMGPGMVEQALKEGYREVCLQEQEAFRGATQRANDAGWIPHRISYAKFVSGHPELQLGEERELPAS